MQLRLFHGEEFDGIKLVDRREDPSFSHSYARMGRRLGPLWAWKCGRCGRHGSSYGGKRYDLLEWAGKNHKCQKVESDYHLV